MKAINLHLHKEIAYVTGITNKQVVNCKAFGSVPKIVRVLHIEIQGKTKTINRIFPEI